LQLHPLTHPTRLAAGLKVSLRLVMCLCFIWLGSGSAWSQFGNDDEDEAGAPGLARRDSLNRDSLAAQKKVRILTERFDLQALEAGKDPRAGVQMDLEQATYFDVLERQEGFAVTLGQLGKPYRRYRYGVDAGFLQTGTTINPFTGEEDVYLNDPTKDIKFFDTRTPYVHVYYGKGKSDLGALWVDVSQNINPWWNVSALYRRETSNGTYSEFATSHYNLYLNTNFRTRNDRYHLFTSGSFSELSDELNGGMAQSDTLAWNFRKGSEPVSLSGADLLKRQNALFFKHYYSILKPDTVENPHKLLVYNHVMRDFFINQYTDTIISESVRSAIFPVYPTLADTADFIYERYQHQRWSYGEGLTYSYTGKRFQTQHQINVLNEIINFDKNLVDYRLNKLTRSWKAGITMAPEAFSLQGDFQLQRTTSNFFETEGLARGKVSLSFPKAKEDYTYQIAVEKRPGDPKPDSVTVSKERRPVEVFTMAMNFNRNPSIQQAFGTGWEGNGFTGDRSFRSRRLELLTAGIEYRSKSTKTNYGEIKGHRVRLTGFLSRQYRMIYVNPIGLLSQSQPGSYLEFLGGEIDARVRWKGLVFETKSTYQVATAVGDQVLIDFYQTALPQFYTRSKLFWEGHDLKIARAIRAGFEYNYFSDFNTPLFDGSSQSFYPQVFYNQVGYHRLDAFFVAQIKKVQLQLRMYNILEELPVRGYFTTTLHPMWDRNFMLGVNWSFYD